MNNDDLLASHELVKTCTDAQMTGLQAEIMDLQPVDLQKINAYLSLGLADDATWRDYAYALSDQEWYRVNAAFHDAMGRWLNLGSG